MVESRWAVCETPVGYCPWYGKDLREWYGAAEALVRTDVTVTAAIAQNAVQDTRPPRR